MLCIRGSPICKTFCPPIKKKLKNSENSRFLKTNDPNCLKLGTVEFVFLLLIIPECILLLLNAFCWIPKTYGAQFSNSSKHNCNVKQLHTDNEKRLNKISWHQETFKNIYYLNGPFSPKPRRQKVNKKSRIQDTKHLSTDADSSTDTTVGWNKNTPEPIFF